MIHENGNYYAFRTATKIKNADQKKVYLIGSGLASLASAVFLIRDVGIPGKNITILEEDNILGGALDGVAISKNAYYERGGRELEVHMECLWDLFRSIPSFDTPGKTVLDEFYEINRNVNLTPCRAIEKCGQNATEGGKLKLSEKGAAELHNLLFTDEKLLENKKITDVLSDEVLCKSNFWLYYRTMFAFQNWHSAMELRRYMMRFSHHIHSLYDLRAIKSMKYTQYESMVIPLQRYLTKAGVKYQYQTIVTNVEFDISPNSKVAKTICYTQNKKNQKIKLGINDYVYITNGSCVENASIGNNYTVAKPKTGKANCWELWKNIAKQSPEFGKPEIFCNDISKTAWMSATITSYNRDFPNLVQKISGRNPYTASEVTGGIVTIKDSNWLMSYHLSTQPHFSRQKKNEIVCWLDGLLIDKPGNYIKKPMKECTGIEIASELLYHMGCNINDIDRMAKAMTTIPVYMPYVGSYFVPREIDSRPLVIPKGAKNFAFIGQYTETDRDVVFTVEYSTRTAIEATYTLFDVDRPVPGVWPSCYDIRHALDTIYILADNQGILDAKGHWLRKKIIKKMLARAAKKKKFTYLVSLLKEHKLI